MKKTSTNQALADAAAGFIAANTKAPRADGKPHKKAPVKKSKRGATKKAKAAKAAPKRAAKSVAGTLRLPKVGEKLARTYKGREIVVEVTEDGFKFEGKAYTSLTAIAKAVTGYAAISGPNFFGLWKRAEVK